MKTPEIPDNENERLKELERLQIIDTKREQDFDELVELASTICGVPVSLITLLDHNRQWFKAAVGTDISETSKDISFCGHTINKNDLFVVENLLNDDRFANNPLVKDDPNLRFYAGMPLTTENGYNIGTLCIIDYKPKHLDENQKNAIRILARQVSNLITLRHKKNELRQKNTRLEDLNKVNQRITEIISHDLKGPISSLKSYLNSSFLDMQNPQEILDFFPIVQGSVEGLHALVSNLMEWSKSISETTITEVNLESIGIEILALMETSAAEKNNKLSADIDSKIDVLADTDMLKFILRNLLNNAMKFTEEGTINLSAAVVDDNFVNIKVKDSGTGITEDLLSRIQQKDRKITTKGTRKEQGTGLGLMLINEFLEIHQSELKIESKKNEGSTFSFALPLATK